MSMRFIELTEEQKAGINIQEEKFLSLLNEPYYKSNLKWLDDLFDYIIINRPDNGYINNIFNDHGIELVYSTSPTVHFEDEKFSYKPGERPRGKNVKLIITLGYFNKHNLTEENKLAKILKIKRCLVYENTH